MNTSHFLTFLEYNYWANEHVLDGLERLTPEQLHAPVPLSHGTAFDLIRHVLDTDQFRDAARSFRSLIHPPRPGFYKVKSGS